MWKALAARARDHGVKRIALEFHGWQLVYNVETLRRLRSEVGDDILGVNLDPSHLFWMGADPVEVARALADCIYHVHIKDVRLEPAAGQNTLLDTKGVLEFASRSWNFVTPGTGHDAAWWRRFLETLQDCGYDGALSIEQEDYTIPLEEALQKAVSLLRAGAARLKYAKPRLTNEAGLFSEQDHRRKFQYRVMAAASRSCTARITRHAHPKDPVERLVAEEVHPQQGTHAAAHHGQKQQIFLRHPLAEPGCLPGACLRRRSKRSQC